MRSNALVRVVLMLAVSCTQRIAYARDADVATLRRWDLPAYTLIAKDGTDPRTIVQRLANTERAVSKLLATPVKPTVLPTYVWLLPRAEWNRYLAPSWAIASEFVPRRFANYLIINADLGPTDMREAVQHEYTHFFLRTQWGGLYPLWFDEGVAGLVGTARIYSRRAVFGTSEAASIGPWIEMQRLFEIDKISREYLSPVSSESVHGESWALVQRGLLSEPPFGDKMFAYLAAINRLVPPADAMTQTFGMSFPQLDTSMRAYLKEKPLPVGRVKFESAPPVAVPEGRVLDSIAALEALALVMLDTGFQPEHTAEVIDTLNRLAPGAPRALVLKLRLAVRDRKDAEALRLADALKANDDVATLRDTGLALFERVHEPVAEDPMSAELRADFEVTAFALLDRALRSDPGDPAAAWGYALLAVRLQENVDLSLERLAAARTRMPGHPDLAEATALALEARGEEDAMMPYLLDALRNTSSAGQRARAAHRISDLRIKEREKAPQ